MATPRRRIRGRNNKLPYTARMGEIDLPIVLSQRLDVQEAERKKFVALLHKYNIHPADKKQ